MAAKSLEHLYVIYDSRQINAGKERVLFVDCGSNVGQGYQWFSRFFNDPRIEFELFEPNPNCHPFLEKIVAHSDGKVRLNKVGAGTEDCVLNFYGLDDAEGGELSQGGSIVKVHNSDRYAASDRKAIEVQVIDFATYLTDKRREFEKIVVKMDIEGAEVDLLEKMIGENSIDVIDILYVEFHSQYQVPPTSEITKERETKIIRHLRSHPGVRFRLWH